MRGNSDEMGWCGTFLDVRAAPAKLKINFTRPKGHIRMRILDMFKTISAVNGFMSYTYPLTDLILLVTNENCHIPKPKLVCSDFCHEGPFSPLFIIFCEKLYAFRVHFYHIAIYTNQTIWREELVPLAAEGLQMKLEVSWMCISILVFLRSILQCFYLLV